MIFVLSPAKRLDYDTPADTPRTTTPPFVAQSAELIAVMRRQSVAQIRALMHLSQPLAELNAERYARWRPRFTAHNSKPALLAFDGDVYDGLKARELDADALEWAQDHLAILSGLYGVLRPLDRMQPYRLEMGTALATDAGRNLYDYWGDTLARHLNRRAATQAVPVVVNLASQEYFRAVDRAALKPRVIECVFEDAQDDGTYRVVGFHAKRARGLMARHAIDRRIELPADLRSFDAAGYCWSATASTSDRLVFRRAAPD